MEYFFDRNLRTEELDSLVESVGWEVRGSKLWKELLTHFSEGIVYLKDQGKLIGLIRGFPIGEEGFLLGDLVVHRDYQKKGLGTSLLNYLQEQYKGRIFFLEAQPETVSFYEKNGFQKICDLVLGRVPMKLDY